MTRSLDRGEFLARLWALFGAPRPREGGFAYYIRDTWSKLDFAAYAGPLSPAYGGELAHRSQLWRVVEAFEEQLEATPPVDCSFEYAPALGELGAGMRILGWRNGQSFDVPDRRGHGVQRPAPERRTFR